MAEHPATHFEVLHDVDGWRTACGSNGQSTTSDRGAVTCLRCMSTKPFEETDAKGSERR